MFTSQIIPFDSKAPTVLQCLFFWFTSAIAPGLQLPQRGTWAIPEVSGEYATYGIQHPCTFRSICRTRTRLDERAKLLALALKP